MLFQRFLVVSQSEELGFNDVLKYELSPYPPSLFEGKYVLRKPDKAQLQEAIRDHATSVENAILQTIPDTDHHVLDGGSLLHRLKWTEGNTYISIADRYASFVLHHYGKATIVFDGYSGGPSTKDNTHQRRKSYVGNKVDISEATKFSGKKEHFLANDVNKQAMIKLIGSRLQEKGCCVIHAKADADVDIAKAAVTMSSYKSLAYVIAPTHITRRVYATCSKSLPPLRHIRLCFCINYTALCKINSIWAYYAICLSYYSQK